MNVAPGMGNPKWNRTYLPKKVSQHPNDGVLLRRQGAQLRARLGSDLPVTWYKIFKISFGKY